MPARHWNIGMMEDWNRADWNDGVGGIIIRKLSNIASRSFLSVLARIRKFAIARNASFCLALFFCRFRLASGLLLAVLGMSLR